MKQYKGQIQNFPYEVVEKMLDHQEAQGIPRDVTIFESLKTESPESWRAFGLCGFNWGNTAEGVFFWREVIEKENFDVFFQKYPTKLIFEENTAYQAETEEEVRILLAEAHRQGYAWSSGHSYLEHECFPGYNCYSIIEGYLGDEEFYTEEGYKIVTIKKFFNQTKTNVDDRFPFKLDGDDASTILSIAGNSWKKKLANKWGSDLVFQNYTMINKQFYNEMRSACTKEQNELFDEIFGKDKVEIDFSILNDEDVFYIKGNHSEYLFKGKNLFESSIQSLNILNKHDCYYYKDSGPFIKSNITEIRKATKEEQELYYTHYPQWSIKDAKDGEPVWVRVRHSTEWYLRYATGRGSIYLNQKKSGKDSTWVHYMKFDPNNLPVNEY